MMNRYRYTSDINVQDYNTVSYSIPEVKRVYAVTCNLEYNLHPLTVMKNVIDLYNFLHLLTQKNK